MRDVHARHRIARHRPRRRHPPVAAVDQPRRGVRQTRRLGLRQRRGRPDPRRHLARPLPLVVPQPQNIDVVRSRRRLDLEPDRLTHIHAHRRREPLDRRIPDPAHLPIRRRITRQRILTRHRIPTRPQRQRRNPQHHNKRAYKNEERAHPAPHRQHSPVHMGPPKASPVCLRNPADAAAKERAEPPVTSVASKDFASFSAGAATCPDRRARGAGGSADYAACATT